MTPVAQLILNNPSWVSYAVILTAFALWLIKGTNESFLLFILSYYWFLTLLSVIPGVVHKELITVVIAALTATLEHFLILSPLFLLMLVLALLATVFILPVLVIHLAREGRLDPQLHEYVQLPKRRLRALLLAFLVLCVMVISFVTSLAIPAVKYQIETAFPQPPPYSAVESVLSGNFIVTGISGISEEVARAALYTSSLTNPMLSTLLWVLAHPHTPERIARNMEVDGVDISLPNIQAYLQVTTYTYALAMFIAGLALLWLIRTTGSIWPAAVSHFLYNLLIGVT
jgi:membrane protease YdiL (CAAX protease family)